VAFSSSVQIEVQDGLFFRTLLQGCCGAVHRRPRLEIEVKMKPKSKPKSKTKSTPEKKQSSGKLRSFLLFGTLFALFCIFISRGGITGFAASMAEDALIRRKTSTASSWLSVAQSTFGNQGRVEYLLGRAARLNGDFPAMMQHLIKAHEAGFDADLLDREQALANLSIGEMDAVLETRARKWIAEVPNDVGLVVDAFVNGLASQSRFPEASQMLEEYEQAFPGDAMVNYRFGVMNEHIRGNARAEEEYTLALQKDPQHLQAAWRLARIISGRNSPEEALEVLKPFDYGKQSLAIKTFMAQLYQQIGNLEKSRELFKLAADQGQAASLESYRVVDETPERFLAASELGILEVKLGNWEEAKKYLEIALKEAPRDFIARNSYGQVLRRLGFNEEAERELARITEERQEYDKITVLRDQINQNQSDTAARVEMGTILFKYESERFGLFWIRSALAFDPKCKEAHQFLADYYAKKAETTLDAAEKQLYQQKANYHLGQIEPDRAVTAT
jgi:tetratricopeptide (TPR) repeat protein